LTALELLTVAQVMDLLQLSRDTVYRLAARGELPGRKIGNVWRFPRHEIEMLFCAHPVGAEEDKDGKTALRTEKHAQGIPAVDV